MLIAERQSKRAKAGVQQEKYNISIRFSFGKCVMSSDVPVALALVGQVSTDHS